MQDFASWGASGRNLGDEVIYYRRPVDGEHNAGWITHADSISGTKFRDFVSRGFEPLMKYGRINSKVNEAKGWGIWEPILSHPDGPAEFPLEQIVISRWYKPKSRGGECPIPTRFPQLLGVKIVEYKCPECSRAPFPELKKDGVVLVSAVADLGNHLRIMHKWDRLSLLGYGDRVGIDFNAIDARTDIVYEYEAEAEEEAAEEETAGFEVETKEIHDCPRCDWKPKAKGKSPAQGLRMHLRTAHPEPVPA